MKNNFLFHFLVVIILIAGATGCEKFTEDNPYTDDRDAFLGEWICTDSPLKNGQGVYSVIITADPDNSAQVKIQNFFQLGNDARPYAIVTRATITVPVQSALPDGSWTVSGYGVLTEGGLEWTSYNGNQYSLKATFRRP